MLAATIEARRHSAAATRAFHRCNIPDVEWSVEVTDEFKTWWHDLDEDEQVSVAATVTLYDACLDELRKEGLVDVDDAIR